MCCGPALFPAVVPARSGRLAQASCALDCGLQPHDFMVTGEMPASAQGGVELKEHHRAIRTSQDTKTAPLTPLAAYNNVR